MWHLVAISVSAASETEERVFASAAVWIGLLLVLIVIVCVCLICCLYVRIDDARIRRLLSLLANFNRYVLDINLLILVDKVNGAL